LFRSPAAAELPDLFARVVADEAVAVALALGPDDRLADVPRAVLPVAAHAEDVDVVGPGEVDAEVIVGVAELRSHADLAAAHRDGGDRVRPEHPVHDVEVVDVLLDAVVAAG